MNDHVNFLLCLRTLILKLYKNKTDLDVIILKEYVLNNSKYFTGTPETIRFIDALFYLCEDFKRENIKSFYIICYDLYVSILDNTIIDIYFLGEQESFVEFKKKISKKNVNFIFHDIKTYSFDKNVIKKELSESKLSIFAYDYSGSTVFLKGGIGKPFSCHLHENAIKPRELSIWYDFLSHQYNRFIDQKFNTVIFGSSYAFHALTDINSIHSTSLSIPGLDITNAHDLYFKTNTINPINKTILCFGFYDLYKEISKGKSIVYTYAKESMNKFNDRHYNSIKKTEINDSNDTLMHKFNTESIDVFIESIYINQRNISECSCHSTESIAEKLSTMQRDINTEKFLNTDKHYLDGLGIVAQHNKYKKHADSFKLNCERIMDIKNAAENNKNHVYMIIPPVSVAYIENLDEQIKNECKRFFSSIESKHFHIFDFSADKDFNYTEFTDGHHLNINGAIKFREKLYSAGVLSNREL